MQQRLTQYMRLMVIGVLISIFVPSLVSVSGQQTDHRVMQVGTATPLSAADGNDDPSPTLTATHTPDATQTTVALSATPTVTPTPDVTLTTAALSATPRWL